MNIVASIRKVDDRAIAPVRWRHLAGWPTLQKAGKAIAADLKSACWKVTLAALLKQKTSATNVWISQKLNMGAPDAVSRYVSEFRRNEGDQNESYKGLTTKVMT